MISRIGEKMTELVIPSKEQFHLTMNMIIRKDLPLKADLIICDQISSISSISINTYVKYHIYGYIYILYLHRLIINIKLTENREKESYDVIFIQPNIRP